MATTDVFNNPSNDYVNPGLAPCAGSADDAFFKFINDGAGIVSGANILAFLNLSNINVPVTTWSIQKKTLQSGEVTYVPGAAKGLMNRTQVFDIISEGYVAGGADPKFFMMLDISVNYYNNFRFYNINLDASSNYSLNIGIDSAMNISLGNGGVGAGMTYDPSTFTFTGTNVGYDFNITNTVLTLIDASMNAASPFTAIIIDGVNVPQVYTLEEDVTIALPATKYPNGAMLGYVLNTKYPTTECMYDSWIYMNHVESPYEVFIPEIIINYITDISTYQSIIFDLSLQWGPFIDNINVSVKDISCNDTSYGYDPIYGGPLYEKYIDSSILTYASYSFSRITNSIIIQSGISDFRIGDPSLWYIADSSIYGSPSSSTPAPDTG